MILRAKPLRRIKLLLSEKVRVRSSRYIPLWTIISLLICSLSLLIVSTVIIVRTVTAEDKSPHRTKYNFNSRMDHVFVEGCVEPDVLSARANATLVMLTRNSELPQVVSSMQSLERHFNQWFQYPWTFLNDEEFSDEFKIKVQSLTHADVQFGVIPKDLWDFPENVSSTWEFREGIETQGDRGVMYGSMESYHKMCRFFSGGFYKHPMITKFEWYWRVEPDVEFFCDLTYDPFIEMAKNGKKYGFTIMIKELVETVPNLFRITKSFLKKHQLEPKTSWKLFVYSYKSQLKYNNENWFLANYKNIKDIWSWRSRAREVIQAKELLKKSKMKGEGKLLSDSGLDEDLIQETISRAMERSRLPELQGEQIDDEEYNLSHFWSNFEIARVDLWNNPLYESYFQYLEQNKGFYKERWGDAPVHTIAIAFMLNMEEIHYFRDIGYKHTTIHHCPVNHPNQLEYKQDMNNYLIDDGKFNKFWSGKFDQSEEYGVGCRCKCPKSEDIEDSSNDYLGDWFDMTSDDYEEPEVFNINRLERETTAELKKEKVI